MVNNLLSVWSTVGSVILAILILLVMITVHEFGHYLAGKILKFKIDEFSVGFGPAFVKIKRKKSGELFAVRLIPLGGYCAFHGEDGLEEETKKKGTMSEGETSEKDTPFVELNGEPTQNGAPMPEESPSKEPSTPPVSAPAHIPKRKELWTEDGTFTRMHPWKRIIVLVAGALMNYILALLLIVICLSCYGQDLVRVRGVDTEGELYEEGYSFQAGDILLRANGKNLYLTTDIAKAVNKKRAGAEITFRVARLQEDGSYKEVDQVIKLRADVTVKNSTEFSPVWKALGVGIEEREDGRYYMLENAVYRFGFFPTLGRSVVYSFKIAGSILRVLGELLTGKLGLSAFGGPITTITTTASVASQSFRSFLEIAGFIGVNLAVFNLLPVPALDGSKVVFTIIEWVRGRPISRKVEAIIHAVGFVFLIGFAILVDVLQFI